jgi:hypothetical protein
MKIALALVVAWAGFLVHNFADLPGTSFADPNTFGPTLVWLVLAIVHLVRRSRFTAAVLFGWVALNLFGGIVSVLPLPILPFVPEQSLYHYGFHVLYAVAQIPALTLLGRDLRQPPRQGARIAAVTSGLTGCRRLGG